MLKVFVGNIAWRATEDDIRFAFESNGVDVESVRILTDDNGRSKGFGFVTVLGKQTFEDVVDRVNNTSVLGRDIHVDQAREKVTSRS